MSLVLDEKPDNLILKCKPSFSVAGKLSLLSLSQLLSSPLVLLLCVMLADFCRLIFYERYYLNDFGDSHKLSLQLSLALCDCEEFTKIFPVQPVFSKSVPSVFLMYALITFNFIFNEVIYYVCYVNLNCGRREAEKVCQFCFVIHTALCK